MGPRVAPPGKLGSGAPHNTPRPRGRRAGHTPPSAVVHVLLGIKATRLPCREGGVLHRGGGGAEGLIEVS